MSHPAGRWRLLLPESVLPLGLAWAVNGANCQTYRQHGLFSRDGVQIGAFFGPEGQLVAFRRALDEARVQRISLPRFALPQDAHFSPSVVTDQRGRLHIMGGAHVTEAFYLRSAPGGSLRSLVAVQDSALHADGPISYPSFLAGEDDALYLTYRIGVPGRGAWQLRAWDEATEAWAPRSTPLASGMGRDTWTSSPYFNNPLRRHAGSFGFFNVWRSNVLGGGRNVVRNIGLDYFEVDPSTSNARTHGGLRLPLPVTPAVSERVVAVPNDGQLSNQAGATRLRDGRPFAAMLMAGRDGRRQVHVTWPRPDGQWRAYPITRFRSDQPMLGQGTLYLPHSRPACVALPDDNVIVLFRSAEHGNRLLAKRLYPPHYRAQEGDSLILWPRDLGFYEPVVDIALAEATGRLCLFVQCCGGAADNADTSVARTAPARLMEWAVPPAAGS